MYLDLKGGSDSINKDLYDRMKKYHKSSKILNTDPNPGKIPSDYIERVTDGKTIYVLNEFIDETLFNQMKEFFRLSPTSKVTAIDPNPGKFPIDYILNKNKRYVLINKLEQKQKELKYTDIPPEYFPDDDKTANEVFFINQKGTYTLRRIAEQTVKKLTKDKDIPLEFLYDNTINKENTSQQQEFIDLDLTNYNFKFDKNNDIQYVKNIDDKYEYLDEDNETEIINLDPKQIKYNNNHYIKNKVGTYTAKKIIDLFKSSKTQNTDIDGALIDYNDNDFILDKCEGDQSYGRKKFIENLAKSQKTIFECFEISKTNNNFIISDQDKETYRRK